MELSVICNLFMKLSDTVSDPVFQTTHKIRINHLHVTES